MEMNDYDSYELQQLIDFAGIFKGLTPSPSQSSSYQQSFANGGSQERHHHHQQVMPSSQVSSLSQQMEIARRVEELNNDCNYISESSNNYTNRTTTTKNTSNYYHYDDDGENQHEHTSQTTTRASLLPSPGSSVVADQAADLVYCHNQTATNSTSGDIWLKSRNFVNENVDSLMPIFLKHLFNIAKNKQHEQPQSSSQQRQPQKQKRKRRKPLANHATLTNRRQPLDLNANHHQSSPLSSSIYSFSDSPREQGIEAMHLKSDHKIGLLLSVDLDSNGELNLDSCSIVKSYEKRDNDMVSPKAAAAVACLEPHSGINVSRQGVDMKPYVDKRTQELQRRNSTPRMLKTANQVKLLEAAFEQDNFLDKYERETLAKKTGLDDTKIRLWFQYKRNKAARKKKM